MNGRAAAKAHLFSYDDFLKADTAITITRDAACFVSLSFFRVRPEPIQALIDDGTEKMARTRRDKCYLSIILYNNGDIK